jgi:hypothetical protein
MSGRDETAVIDEATRAEPGIHAVEAQGVVGLGMSWRLTCGHGLRGRDESGGRGCGTARWCSSGVRALDFGGAPVGVVDGLMIDLGAAENQMGGGGRPVYQVAGRCLGGLGVLTGVGLGHLGLDAFSSGLGHWGEEHGRVHERLSSLAIKYFE